MDLHGLVKTIAVATKAHKQIHKMHKADMKTIYEALDALKAWPNCRNVKSLTTRDGYRLRVGDYRIFFMVDGDTITITEVKRRDERTY